MQILLGLSALRVGQQTQQYFATTDISDIPDLCVIQCKRKLFTKGIE